jgi:hypothetical protein
MQRLPDGKLHAFTTPAVAHQRGHATGYRIVVMQADR